MLIFLLISLLFVSLSLSSKPLPPKNDPWYTAPSDFKAASPGDILRIRTAPGNLTAIFSKSSAAYNILYRTTNSRYEASWAVTTLFVPQKTNGSALLSYQIPYNTVDVNGSPSYLLYTPPSPSYATTNDDIQNALGYGWYVNVPDFEGPLASFTEGVQAGHAVLDSIRAVRNAGHGLSNDARYAMWGYSGGSLASEWAAELQVQYAPELKFAGTAVGGLVSNVSSIYAAITGTMWAGLIPESLLGLVSQYPTAYEYLLSELKTEGPFNKTGFLSAKNMTISEAFVAFNNTDVFQYFKNGQAVIESPIIRNLLITQGQMGLHGIPEMPLFIYKAIADEITHINNTNWQVDFYCSVGANILYERNTVGGHLAEETNGDSRALKWLDSVLSGTYRHTGCTIKDVTWNKTDSPL